MRGLAGSFGVGLALGAAGALWAVRQLNQGAVYLAAPDPSGRTSAQVFFSPKGGCTAAIAEAITAARERVLVQAYSFTSDPIRATLVETHRRGVRVEVVMDKQAVDDAGSELKALVHAGIPVWLDGEHPIAHNKVMVIDGGTVVTGSFNFTRQAEIGNAENLLVIHHPELAARYATNWEEHRSHSHRAPRAGR